MNLAALSAIWASTVTLSGSTVRISPTARICAVASSAINIPSTNSSVTETATKIKVMRTLERKLASPKSRV